MLENVSQIAVGAGIGVGLAALGVGIGQGIAANSGLAGMARQPEFAGRIQTGMLIALAFTELVFLLTFVLFLNVTGKLPNYEEARTVESHASRPVKNQQLERITLKTSNGSYRIAQS